MLALLTLPRGPAPDPERDAFGIVIRPAPAPSSGRVVAPEPRPRLSLVVG